MYHQQPTGIPLPSLSSTQLLGSQIQALVHKKLFQVILKCFINGPINRLKEVSMLRLKMSAMLFSLPLGPVGDPISVLKSYIITVTPAAHLVSQAGF